MAAESPPRIRWCDDVETAEIFFRSRLAFVRRTGWPLVINTATTLVMLPVSLLNWLITLPVFAMWFLVVRVRASRAARRGVPHPDALRAAANTSVLKLVEYFPPYMLLQAVGRLRQDRRWRRFFDNRRFILYLRPFRMDNRTALTPHDHPLELEGLIQLATKSIGPMVALDDNAYSSSLRADRIHMPSDDWQTGISYLLKHSGYVVMIPEDTPGTLWEIERILENRDYVLKTVFLNINSAGRDHPYFARDRKVYSDDDGKTFLETLNRIHGRDDVSWPALDEILCAFFVGSELNLICAKRLTDPGMWGQAAKVAMSLRLAYASLRSVPGDTMDGSSSTSHS